MALSNLGYTRSGQSGLKYSRHRREIGPAGPTQPWESPMIFMNVDRRGRGTLPEQVRKDLGIGSEETNLIILDKTERGTYEMVPATLIPKDQLWFYHPEMQARIAQAEANRREGRFFSAD